MTEEGVEKKLPIEIKYKRLGERDKVNASDLYQVFYYSSILGKPDEPFRAIIIYPQTSSVLQVKELSFFLHQGPKERKIGTVRVVLVNISSLIEGLLELNKKSVMTEDNALLSLKWTIDQALSKNE